ncbi:MAG: hypothetical protein R3F46_16545, partial [bacterium]
YVAPYDLQSQQQGPASGIVSIDLDTGTVNSSPVASLSVTPDFAGAPAEITLDASASYDPDGSIAAYEWDFDGDGTMDWLSTDPLPETSSDGTVDSFVEVEPGKMRASYNRGNADYLHPSVTATDDLSAASLPVDAQLGISGWVDSEFIWSDADPRISFNPERFFHDDINDRLVCTGPSKDNETMYMATRTGFEQWVEEVIYTTDNPVIQEFVKGKGILFNRAWPAFLSDGSPIAFIHIGWGSAFPAVFTMFLGEKKSGSWQIRHLYEHPEGFVNPGYSSFTRIGPDQFAIHCGETDTSIPLNMSARYFVIFYDNGDLSVEYIGYGEYTEDKWAYINFIANSANANLICPFEYYVDLQNPQPELHWYERQGPDDWELQSMNFDSEPGLLDVLRFMNISVDSAGTMNLLMASEPATFDDRKAFLLRITGQKQEFIELPTELPVVATFSGHTGMLIETDLGVLIMIGLDPTLPSAPNSNVYTWSQSWLSDENLLFVEDIAKTYEDGVNPRETTGARLIVDSPSLETICVVSGWLYEYGTDDEKGNGAKVLKRVDPRSN